jgi:hypothetical protein
MRRLFLIPFLLAALPALGQTIFSCPPSTGFASSGSCGVSFIFPINQPFAVVGSTNGSTPALSGTAVNLVNSGAVHNALNLNYQTAVNVQAFTGSFTYTANGWNVALTFNNNTNPNSIEDAPGGAGFSGGAGCEGAVYQAFPTTPYPPFPNNVAYVNFDQGNYNTPSGFTYSNVQFYGQAQSPCIPNDGQSYYFPINKISTSPVALNSPGGSDNTTTGDTITVNFSYDGTNLNICMIDVTLANGTCNTAGTSGTGTYFQQTWAAVNLPSMVGSNTAYVGLAGGTNAASTAALLITGFSYTVNSAPATPSLSTWTTAGNAGASAVAAPTFSPPAGSYSGTQTVTLASTTSNASFTGSISGTTLTTSGASGTIAAGQMIYGSGVTAGTVITAGSGTSWTVNNSQTVGSESMTSGPYFCYETSTTTPSIMPQTSGAYDSTYSTLCPVGTLYTGPVSITPPMNLFAQANLVNTELPSNTVEAQYTSGGTPAAAVITGVKFTGIQIQ